MPPESINTKEVGSDFGPPGYHACLSQAVRLNQDLYDKDVPKSKHTVLINSKTVGGDSGG